MSDPNIEHIQECFGDMLIRANQNTDGSYTAQCKRDSVWGRVWHFAPLIGRVYKARPRFYIERTKTNHHGVFFKLTFDANRTKQLMWHRYRI